MGCASSKETRCKHCKTPYSPLTRSYSVPVHHPALRKGDSYHVVALTSSTLGSIPLDTNDQIHSNGKADNTTIVTTNNNNKSDSNIITSNNGYISGMKSEDFMTEVLQAKNWSNMIEEKIPKFIPRTPIRTPPGEPETINTWEMMEGLDEYSPLRLAIQLERSLSFNAVSSKGPIDHLKLQENGIDSPTLVPSKLKVQENGTESPKPQWLQMVDNDPNSNLSLIISEFDPEIVSQFRKALEEISPVATVHLKSPEREKMPFSRDLPKEFVDTKKVDDDIITLTNCPPCGEEKVVIYFTSLRGVRKTYEDCCQVRVIFKSFAIRIDERDVSMHYGFREELKELLGEIGNSGALPRIFVKGKYIGGVEEIKRLDEDGKLEKLVEGCAMVEEGNGYGTCQLCGDIRFVPCDRCSGSCKIYCEDDNDDEYEGEDSVGEFQRCPDCNENGIIRCPVCCY